MSFSFKAHLTILWERAVLIAARDRHTSEAIRKFLSLELERCFGDHQILCKRSGKAEHSQQFANEVCWQKIDECIGMAVEDEEDITDGGTTPGGDDTGGGGSNNNGGENEDCE